MNVFVFCCSQLSFTSTVLLVYYQQRFVWQETSRKSAGRVSLCFYPIKLKVSQEIFGNRNPFGATKCSILWYFAKKTDNNELCRSKPSWLNCIRWMVDHFQAVMVSPLFPPYLLKWLENGEQQNPKTGIVSWADDHCRAGKLVLFATIRHSACHNNSLEPHLQ